MVKEAETHHSWKSAVPALAAVDFRGFGKQELVAFQPVQIGGVIEQGRVLALIVPVSCRRMEPIARKALPEVFELRDSAFLGAENRRPVPLND